MRILVVAPHADDETLGMGGTIARLAREGHHVMVAVMTGPGTKCLHPLWPEEIWRVVHQELREACAILGVADIAIENIPAVCVADEPVHEVNAITRSVIERARPEALYVPFPFDLHRDHRELFHSFSVHWRPHLPLGHSIRTVYSFEVPSETHLNTPYLEAGFLPNTWVDISDTLQAKLHAFGCYKSQVQKHPSPRSVEAIRSLAVWRGAQIGVEAAEAFVLIRRLV